MIERDKKINDLLKGNFDEPAPSADFTKNVMDNILASEALKEQKKFEYVPVISRLGWALICVLFLAVVYLGLTSEKGSAIGLSNYIPELNFNTPLINSQVALFAVLSIFILLFIDRLISRFKLSGD